MGYALHVALMLPWIVPPVPPDSHSGCGPAAGVVEARSNGAAGDGEAPFRPSRDDRAVAIGHFLDTPLTTQALDVGISLAERLRLRYGIDTGDRQADRLAAARFAKIEILDTLVLTEKAIREAARELGYSLDPALCGNACGNIEALARLELQRRALIAFADRQDSPRASSDSPASPTATSRPQPE